MKNIALAIVAATVVGLSASASLAQTTSYFETSAVRQGVPGWTPNTSGQYSYAGPYVEYAGSGGFGFPTRSPDASRLIADGLKTDRGSNAGTLATIGASLTANDADLFQIEVTNPATFSARIGNFFTSGTFVGQQSGAAQSLFLFDNTGKAIRGGTARLDWTAANNGTPDNDAKNVVLTLPPGSPAGKYWVGISANISSAFNATVNGNAPIDVIVPRNNANEKLFDEALLLANPGTVYDALSLADQVLSTDRLKSWQVTPFEDGTIPNPALATTFLPNGSVVSIGIDFTNSGTGFGTSGTIFLSGANFAIPEPASMASVIAAGALLVARRRRV